MVGVLFEEGRLCLERQRLCLEFWPFEFGPCLVFVSVTHFSRAAKRGCFKRGGFPIWTCPSFFCPFLSFWDFPGDFPDLLRDGPGIFPICPFPLSRPIQSTYEEQSRKGSVTQSGLVPKKVGNTRVWKHPGLASLKFSSIFTFYGL